MRITTCPALPGTMLLVLMILLSGPTLLRAQQMDDNASGTTYIIAFPDTITNHFDARIPPPTAPTTCALFLYSASGANRVRIISAAGTINTVTLEAGKFLNYAVNAAPIVNVLNSVQFNTFRIEAEQPIIVYCYMFIGQSCEAWTPIPVEQWGTRYNIACAAGDYVNDIGTPSNGTLPVQRRPAPAELLIIAAYDNTHVSILNHERPLVGNPALSITLGKGEAYQVQSFMDTASSRVRQPDIAGIRIVADKPIGVISGNTRASVTTVEGAITGNSYKNMLMEWLSPVESQGTEFVYMPTWDSHRPGINAPAERAGDLTRIYGTSDSATAVSVNAPGGNNISHVVAGDTMRELFYGDAQAVYLKTSHPAMVMMESGAVVALESSIPCGETFRCLTYSTLSSYMVEITPREQWVNFAPYYAPASSGTLQHFINVVCDTSDQKNIYTESGGQFPFTRKIPGTSLIWGSMGVSPGQDHYLAGTKGARFGGFVYGMVAGKEGLSLQGGLVSYMEISALSYGYPLAPGRRLLLPPDNYRIDTVRDCASLHIMLQALNANPAGLRSITLDPTSVVNARLMALDPPRLDELVGSATGKVDLVPIDPLRDAAATIVIRDRTGAVHDVYYAYRVQRLDVNRSAVDFGELAPGQRREDTITFTNPLNRDVDVASVTLAMKSAGFSIASITPAVPVSVPPGGRLMVVVVARPANGDAVVADSVKVALQCASIAVPLHAATVQPVIVANDLDFGTMRRGEPARALPLDICNTGRGTIIFGGDTGSASSAALTWGDPGFSVSQSALDSLRAAWIAPGACFRIHVAFDPSTTGEHRTTARALTNAHSIKDTSLWKAVVVDAPLGLEDVAAGGEGYRLESIRPNPTGARMEIAYRLGSAGPVTLAVYNATGERVALLADGMQSAGEHLMTWDAGAQPGGLYFCRISSGGWSATRSMIVVK